MQSSPERGNKKTSSSPSHTLSCAAKRSSGLDISLRTQAVNVEQAIDLEMPEISRPDHVRTINGTPSGVEGAILESWTNRSRSRWTRVRACLAGQGDPAATSRSM